MDGSGLAETASGRLFVSTPADVSRMPIKKRADHEKYASGFHFQVFVTNGLQICVREGFIAVPAVDKNTQTCFLQVTP